MFVVGSNSERKNIEQSGIVGVVLVSGTLFVSVGGGRFVVVPVLRWFRVVGDSVGDVVGVRVVCQ